MDARRRRKNVTALRIGIKESERLTRQKEQACVARHLAGIRSSSDDDDDDALRPPPTTPRTTTATPETPNIHRCR